MFWSNEYFTRRMRKFDTRETESINLLLAVMPVAVSEASRSLPSEMENVRFAQVLVQLLHRAFVSQAIKSMTYQPPQYQTHRELDECPIF